MITQGTEIMITAGYAQHMSAPVEEIEPAQEIEGVEIPARYGVTLPGYGFRWFPSTMVERLPR